MTAVNESAARSYGGETGDERLARRREELADAAFALVASGGWRSLTVGALCRGAGLNKRYFYESYADIDAVIAAVTHRLAGAAIDATLAAIAGGDITDDAVVEAGVAAFVTHLTEDPRRARVLFGAVPAGDAAAGHRAAAIRDVITIVAAQGRDRHHLQAGDPVVATAAAMIVGGTSQAVLDWLDGRPPSSPETFAADLAAMWKAVGDAAAARAALRPQPTA